MNIWRVGGAVILAAISFGPHTAAAEFSYELRVGGSYSDNIGRTDIDEQEEIIAIGGLRLDWERESRRLFGSLQGDFEFRDYLDETFGSENISYADLDLEFRAAPDIFHWVVTDSYGTVRRDPFRAETPDTRENVNRFSTGPDLTLRISARTIVRLRGRYSATRFDNTEADSDSNSGTLTVARAISPNREISVNVSGERVEFDADEAILGYDRYSAYVGFESRISRGTLSARLGVNELHDAGEEFRGTLAELAWRRELSPLSQVSLSYTQQYSDAGELFQRFQSTNRISSSIGAVTPAADPLENRRLSLSYGYQRGGVDSLLTLSANEDDYRSRSDLDSRRLAVRGSIRMPIGPDWAIGGDIAYEERHFDSDDRDDDYVRFGLQAERRLGQRFWLSLEYDYDERSSTEVGQDYRENRITLLLTFRPSGR